jgi:hypothetical protein
MKKSYRSAGGMRCQTQRVQCLQTAIGVPRVCSCAMSSPPGAAAVAPSSTPGPPPFAMALSLALLLGTLATMASVTSLVAWTLVWRHGALRP